MPSSQITNKNKVINIGIIGYASIAKNKLIPAILNSQDKFNLIGIASRNNNFSNEVIKKYSCSFFKNYDELIENSQLDAIYIPLPNALHFEWAKKSLKNGLHVLLEKPSTCSHKETVELLELAKAKELTIVETFQFRFHKQFEVIKNLICERKIGDLRNIRSSFSYPKINYPDDIRFKKSLGGGSLFDAGCYPLKVSTLLLGNKVKVLSAALSKSSQLDIDIWGSAHLESTNNICSQISFGIDNHYQCSLEVFGSNGKISASRIFTAPNNLDININLEYKNFREKIFIGKDDHFKNLLSYFYKTIFDNEVSKKELEEIFTQSKLLSEIQEKAYIC